MRYSEPLRVLSMDEMQRIHEAALTILETVGMKIDHPEALRLLRGHGCTVDEATRIVKFPRKVAEASVTQMRRAYANPKRVPERMAQRYAHFRLHTEPHRVHEDFTTSTGGFCCFILDLDGNRRTATMDDVRRSLCLAQQLKHIDYTGLPVSDQTMPPPLRPVAMAAEVAKYTTKFGGIETFRRDDISFLIELGIVVKGSEAALKAEPILIGYGETRSPLCLDFNMADIFMEYIRRGYPQTMDTMPNGGATTPMTAAGTLAVGMAETIGPMVLAHAMDPNALVGVDIIPSFCDMQSGIFRYSSPERWSLLIARVQLITEFYGCPSGVHGGKTDSCFFDEQAGFDKAMTTLIPVLAGAVGIGVVGQVENAVTFSPTQLVLDAEYAGAVRAMLKGIEVNDDTLAIDVVRQVGPGGQFLDSEHTVTHFRETLFDSRLFQHLPWAHAHSLGGGIEQRAATEARRIWEQPPEPVLSQDKIRDVEKIVERAKKTLLA